MKPAPVHKENGSHSVGHGMNTKYKHSEPTADTPPGVSSGEKSRLQLLQASEGARELTRMIDSLSKAPSLVGRSKDIARDLLRGAQGLQSSLAMLAELQEASKSDVVCRSRVEAGREELGARRTARSKRFAEEVKDSRRFGLQEHKKMPSRQRPEFLKQGMGAGELMVSERFGSRKSRFSVDESPRCGAEEVKTMSRLKFKQRFEYIEEGIGIGVQKPRSSGRSSGELKPEPRLSVDSIEELRRAIKDGLSPQNLLPRSSGDESPRSLRRPRFEERRYERKEKPKQAKGPNVIAKLMGLEETEDEMRKKKKKESLVMPRPAFDIDDRPKARKTHDPTQKSLHEIIAALQFKGLLKSGRGEDFERTIYEVGMPKSNMGNFNEGEDVPPIVIMKPLYLPHWERGEVKSTEETSAQVSPMANTLTTVAQKLQRKKGSESSKKTNEAQKLLLNVKKEEEDMKKKISPSKNKISQKKPETKNSTSVAKEKKKKKASAAKSIRKSADIKNCEDGKRSILQEGKDLFSKNSTSTVHDLTLGAYKQAKSYIQDGKQENLCEMKTTTTARVASEVEEDLMCLLLSSRSFLNHAKELFLIDAHHQPVHYKRKGIGEDVMRNAKLYLDCGKELMARKSNQIVKMYYCYSVCSSSASPSLTRLAEEISSAIEETLSSYSQIDDNLSFEDHLYLRLGRDLGSKDMMASANWDVGWAEDWVCTEEASRVVGELGEFILVWLLTEVAQDLVWL